MKNKKKSLFFVVCLLSTLFSCSQTVTGRIKLKLNDGHFSDPSFSTTYLEGKAGQPVMQDIPDPVKDGYYFVGWREKTSTNAYRNITKRKAEDGKYYYYYPYGSDTFYAYFEPLVTLTFHLGEGNDDVSFLSPTCEASNFSDGVLNGYANKSIPSTDYLPSVDTSKSHLNFSYWYSEYPMIVESDENKTTHYKLDTSATKGIYRFDEAFSTGMAFPIDKNVDLYAFYESDATITMHYGLDGFSDYSFQAKDTIESELSSLMKSNFNIDFSLDSKRYFYPSQSKDNRFAGFFLDDKFTKQFFLDSPISNTNFDLYLKWEKKVTVTLDYGEGTLNGHSSDKLSDVYENDVLGEELFKAYQPSNPKGEFINYTYNGKNFNFSSDIIPDTDITLLANYENYPSLTLSVDYPDDYKKVKLSDETTYVKVGSSLSSAFTDFKKKINDSDLVFSSYYTLDSSNNVSELSYSTMPKSDLHVYVKYDYVAKYNISTYANTDSGYTLQSSSSEINGSFSKDTSDQPIFVNESSITSLKDDYVLSGETYLYDGLYYDTALTDEVLFPLYEEGSHSEKITLSLYRKMSKAIRLSFYDYTTKTSLYKSLDVIPNHSISEYQSDLDSLFSTGKEYYVEVDSSFRRLSGLLPDEDTIVYVK